MKLYYDIELKGKITDKVVSVGEPEITDSEIIFQLENETKRIYRKEDVIRYVVATFEPFSP